MTVARTSSEARDLPQEGNLSLGVLLLSGVQHVAVIAPSGLVFPLLVLRAAESSVALQEAVITASLIALGLGSLLLCARGHYFGSGYLAPSVFTAAYLPPSLAAAKSGGMGLVFGMTIFAGLCEILFSFALRRLRPFFPVEISGLAVVMIGLILGLLGFRLTLGMAGRTFGLGEIEIGTAALGLVTLAVIVTFNVWGKGPLKAFSVLFGLTLVYLLASLLGALEPEFSSEQAPASLMALPSLPLLALDFDWSLVVPFLIGALACALRAVGDITTCQRITNPKWVRPDMGSIERAIRADGFSTIIAGGLGTVGLNTFSGSIGLSQATGIMQRSVGLSIAGLFVLLAFLPPLHNLFITLPAPLFGAILMFSAAFILANGLNIIVARMLDTRRILTIGIALILGISHDVYPHLFDSLPLWLRSFAGSSLVVALVTALLLNALFRIGTKQTAKLEATLDQDLLGKIFLFCRENGAIWGARRDVMDRVVAALTEAGELAMGNSREKGKAALEIRYEEFRILADFSYETAARAGSEEFSEEGMMTEELELRLMRHFADQVTLAEAPGRKSMRLVFHT